MKDGMVCFLPQCHEIIWHFLFHDRTPRSRLTLCKSDSAQANTARSGKLKSLQIQNWLTLRRVGLCTG